MLLIDHNFAFSFCYKHFHNHFLLYTCCFHNHICYTHCNKFSQVHVGQPYLWPGCMDFDYVLCILHVHAISIFYLEVQPSAYFLNCTQLHIQLCSAMLHKLLRITSRPLLFLGRCGSLIVLMRVNYTLGNFHTSLLKKNNNTL